MRVVVFRLLAGVARFDAVEVARPLFAAVFFAVVPDVERARDVPDREVVPFAFEAVDFARVPVADFARDVVDFAVDFAREVADFAREVVADFAFDAADFAREVVDFGFEAVDFVRDVPEVERARDAVLPAERFAAVVFPPLLPAAFFAVDPARLEAERVVPEAERDRLDEVDPERDRLVPPDLLDLRGVAARTRETVSLCGCCGCSASLASSSGCGE